MMLPIWVTLHHLTIKTFHLEVIPHQFLMLDDILFNSEIGASVSTKSLNHSDTHNIGCFQNHSENVHDVPQGSP